MHTSGAQLVQSGIMRKGVDLKFEITSALSLTDSGWIRLHPTKVRVLGVNGQSLLHALGLHLDDLLDLSKSAAARVKGDDIYLDPTKILPPPAIAGRLTSVRVEGDALVQEFARLPDDSLFSGYARADSAAPNYLFFRGGRLRFGRLEMRDTQLQILDLDPSDPFDLFLAEYNKQLVAGYSKNRPNLSLQAFFPDFTDLGCRSRHPVEAGVAVAASCADGRSYRCTLRRAKPRELAASVGHSHPRGAFRSNRFPAADSRAAGDVCPTRTPRIQLATDRDRRARTIGSSAGEIACVGDSRAWRSGEPRPSVGSRIGRIVVARGELRRARSPWPDPPHDGSRPAPQSRP